MEGLTKFSSIITKDMKTIHHRQGIKEDVPDGLETYVSYTSPTKVKRNRGGNNPKPLSNNDHKEFNVKGKTFHKGFGEGGFEGFPSEKFDACLGIHDGKMKEESYEKIVASTKDSSNSRIVYFRFRVEFTPDDDISLL